MATALGVLLIGYLCLCGGLFFFQRSLIYFPQPRSSRDAATITLQVPSAQVLVSVREIPGRHAVLYFGGNAEDVSLNVSDFSAVFPDRAIYLMHYRGYGGSTGNPSEAAVFADAVALFDEVHPRHPDIEVVGRSLGSGVAVYLASRRPVTRLVLITPFDSLLEVATRRFPFVPVSWLLKDKFESWRYAPQVTAPTVILAADHDELIPRASSELLRTRFGDGIATFTVLPDTGHNSISENPEYLPLLGGVTPPSR